MSEEMDVEDIDEVAMKWRGASIDDVYNKLEMFERENQAPAIISSKSHTVLFNLPLPSEDDVLPVPCELPDKWDSNHVKLPCSSSSVYAEIDEDGNKSSKSRWELIKKSLTETSIKNSRELENSVKLYNTKQAQSWEFTALHALFEDEFSEEDSDFFFEMVLPKIIDLALRLPQLIQSPIPLLKQKSNHTISMSQEQCSCLLANAFLCTFPGRNVGRKDTDYPEINFNRLFSTKGEKIMEKIKCILNYFKRTCLVEMATGVLTFQRRYIEPSTFPNWKESDAKFSKMKLLVSSDGTIEDGTSMLQVDFANRYLGGGVLGWGCVQEEIRFIINPEMIVGMLFCESMKSEEAIVMTGCEQFNKYKGYASSFKWDGNNTDTTKRDKFRRRMVYVVAIDALSFHKPHMQFESFALKREANKAFSGFYHDPSDELSPIPVSSGNWGCGVFRGFKPLKALIQLMACCVNRRNLVYYTFGETDLMNQIHEMFVWLCEKDVSVGQLWTYMEDFRKDKMTAHPEKLYKFIKEEHNRKLIYDEIKRGLDVMSDSDFEDEEEELSEKRKIKDEISVRKSEDEKSSIESPVKHLSKKVKIEEETEFNEKKMAEKITQPSPKNIQMETDDCGVSKTTKVLNGNSEETSESFDENCEEKSANNNENSERTEKAKCENQMKESRNAEDFEIQKKALYDLQDSTSQQKNFQLSTAKLNLTEEDDITEPTNISLTSVDVTTPSPNISTTSETSFEIPIATKIKITDFFKPKSS